MHTGTPYATGAKAAAAQGVYRVNIVDAAPRSFRKVEDWEIDNLVRDMEHNGYGILEDYLNQMNIAAAQEFVRAEAQKHDGRYFSYRGSAPVAGSILERLGHSREFRSIFERVFERGLGRPPSSDALFQVLRCLKGDSGQKESFRYHFDAYVVTALVPIEIPTEGRWHGDLLMYPNIRQVCSSVSCSEANS
jgi:hypothetical protein